MNWTLLSDVNFSNPIDLYNIPLYHNVYSYHYQYKIIPIIVNYETYEKCRISSHTRMIMVRICLIGYKPYYFYIFHKDNTCLYTLYLIPYSNKYLSECHIWLQYYKHSVEYLEFNFRELPQKIHLKSLNSNMLSLTSELNIINRQKLMRYHAEQKNGFGVMVRNNPPSLYPNEYYIYDNKQHCLSYKLIDYQINEVGHIQNKNYIVTNYSKSYVLYFDSHTPKSSKQHIFNYDNKIVIKTLHTVTKLPSVLIYLVNSYLDDSFKIKY